MSRDRELPARAVPADGELDAPAGGGELHRVAEQVEHDLLQPVGVSHHGHARHLAHDVERHALLPRQRARPVEGHLDDGHEVHEPAPQAQAARAEQRHVGELLDEPRAHLERALDRGEPLLLERSVLRGLREQVHPVGDRAERAAQLVGGARHEVVVSRGLGPAPGVRIRVLRCRSRRALRGSVHSTKVSGRPASKKRIPSRPAATPVITITFVGNTRSAL